MMINGSDLAPYLGYLWLIAGLFLLMFEVGTPGLFIFLSLACGAFSAAVGAFMHTSIITQCWTAAGGTSLSFIILKYFFAGRKQYTPTNVNALIGQEGTVTETIEPRKTGRVKIRGEEWQAVCLEPQILQKGTLVKVIRIEGNKLIVK
ncbi:MAG: NfeD family protein [Candidatus Babeliales bacterium]|jgi:membrane protein implicated in regulation of membrane protease activity